MKERPILFNGAMVRAILAGEKTQTRRLVKPQPAGNVWQDEDSKEWFSSGHGECGDTALRSPYGQPGDRLWVRESFQPLFVGGEEAAQSCYKTGRGYAASYPATDGRQEFIDADTDGMTDRVTPSIHMPRWASRILLEIVSVRVERLQDISEADADAEGCERLDFEREVRDHSVCWCCGGTRLYTSFSNGGACPDTDCRECDTYAKRYRHLWESINGQHSWTANPWVWVVEFRRVQP